MSDPIEASTVGELVRKAAATFGDAEAVVGEGTRLTFNELDARSRALARRLLGRGVAKGTHVGVSFGNNPDFLVSLLAVSRIGAVAVPISTFAPGRELLRLIRYGDLAAILTTQQVVGVDQVDRLTAAIPGLAETKGTVLTLPAAPSLRWIEFARSDDDPPPWVTLPEDDGIAAPVDDALLDAMEEDVVGTDVALMIHTSGTTSDPKGVPHTHDTVCFRVRYLAERMQYRPGDRTYTSQVLFWIGGLTMSFLTSIAAGATSVWCERFDADEVLPLIERERITRLAIYPHQVAQLLAHPEFASTDRSSLRIGRPAPRAGWRHHRHPHARRPPHGPRHVRDLRSVLVGLRWHERDRAGPERAAGPRDHEWSTTTTSRSATVRRGRSSCAAAASRPATTSDRGTSASTPTDGSTPATVVSSTVRPSTSSGG